MAREAEKANLAALLHLVRHFHVLGVEQVQVRRPHSVHEQHVQAVRGEGLEAVLQLGLEGLRRTAPSVQRNLRGDPHVLAFHLCEEGLHGLVRLAARVMQGRVDVVGAQLEGPVQALVIQGVETEPAAGQEDRDFGARRAEFRARHLCLRL